MGEALRQRIQQEQFAGADEEALLNILVTADHLRSSMDRLCGSFGISASQYNVLRILRGAQPGGHSRSEILRRMLERAPDVTRLIDRLVEAGLVQRRRTQRDRRLSISEITSQGLALLETMDPAVALVRDDFASRVSLADCQELSRICESLYGEPTNSTNPNRSGRWKLAGAVRVGDQQENSAAPPSRGRSMR